MSVIQKIRDKYARWAVIAIAVSLLGFIMMDAFAGKTGLFSNRPSNTIGKVNGKPIDRIAFEQKIQNEEKNEQQQGYPVDDNRRQQIVQGLWDEQVTNLVMNDEYEKLGLTVTDKEMREVLYGANPPQFLSQVFTDSSGKFNGTAAQQQVNMLLKSGKQEQKDYINQQMEMVKSQRLLSKYMALLTNTIYYPKWYLEKRNADNSLLGKISYVTVNYSTVPDSTVKISDDEIRSYEKEHKDEFEQKDESRSISYVLFSAAPTASDSLTVRTGLLQLKPAFDTAKTNLTEFTQVNGTDFPFFDTYVSRNAIQSSKKDSFLSAPIGQVYGPYLDVSPKTNKSVYVLSKILDVKQWPDTVKVRHILIATMQSDPQTRQMYRTREDSTAKHLMDSIQGLLNKGQKFDSLVAKFSEDPGSKSKGGVYDNMTANGQMVPEFTEFAFGHKTGDVGIVKTEFGYHLIEVMSQKGSSPAYKIAYLSRDILASPETDQQAHNDANLFAGDSRDLQSFNANFDKNLRSKGKSKLVANDIGPMDYSIQGLPPARSFVKKIFDASKGDVLDPERVGDDYVVAIVTEVNEPGLQSVNAVRTRIEPLLRNRKKGEELLKKIGQVTTLEQVSSKMQQPVQTADSLRMGGGPSLGYEPKVIGATFNPANKGKIVSEPIAGTSGVFVLRVDNVTTTPVETANIDEQRRMMEMQQRQGLQQQMQQGYNPILEVLKRSASIKDNRSKFY
ncbi:MAG: peptidylprolyl isomerase [Flavisolibacter sp.]